MVHRMIIHLNIELKIPVIYRADFGLRGFTSLVSLTLFEKYFRSRGWRYTSVDLEVLGELQTPYI